ncbi:AraC family transcriptional regulator [Paenibacillaceae bacterium]|nr:AraC family transcriptional regulator [Paenibacillaceae bacterium]
MDRTYLQDLISVQTIITMYYFEHGKNYVFLGEKHNFWEILYVDSGEIRVETDDAFHLLKQGMMIFHKPNEFHSFHATQGRALNVIVLTFDCASPAMAFFHDQVMQLDDEDRNLLALLIKEGENAFEFPFAHPLVRRTDVISGAEQLIRCYLETLLIRMIRKSDRHSHPRTSALSTPSKEMQHDLLTRQIIQYMEEHTDTTVGLEEISQTFYIGKTQLKEMFRKSTGTTIKKYFNRLKVETAKRLIREETENFTAIAQRLGFGSIHSFSRAFKQATDLSPSEYARSVKARMRSDQA